MRSSLGLGNPGQRWRGVASLPASRWRSSSESFSAAHASNTGCTPTETLVASAYAAYLARSAADYGVTIGGRSAIGVSSRPQALGRIYSTCEFVPKKEIDELYLNSPPYIVPDGEVGQQAFAVIREAIRKEGMWRSAAWSSPRASM
jgi:hypothetical protein